MSTNAERQRRHRAHKRGDHSLCDPERCRPGETPPVTEPVTRDAVTPTPVGLGPRARRLWADLAGQPLRPAERLLVEEVCRTADRLDRLDRILRGDDTEWLALKPLGEDGSVVKVVVTSVLAESRQQQTALKGMVAELRQSIGKGEAPEKPKTEGSDDLAARREARRRAAGL